MYDIMVGLAQGKQREGLAHCLCQLDAAIQLFECHMSKVDIHVHVHVGTTCTVVSS